VFERLLKQNVLLKILKFKVCASSYNSNKSPTRWTIFQFIILTFIYNSTSFERFPARHQELNDCSGSLWFYLRIVVIAVLCSWSGRLPEDNKLENCSSGWWLLELKILTFLFCDLTITQLDRSTVTTTYTTWFNSQKLCSFPHSAFRFSRMILNIAIISLKSINALLPVTETQCRHADTVLLFRKMSISSGQYQGYKKIQKFRCHLKIIGARRVAESMSCSEDRQILGATRRLGTRDLWTAGQDVYVNWQYARQLLINLHSTLVRIPNTLGKHHKWTLHPLLYQQDNHNSSHSHQK
jgi:hypothetical protein